MAPATTAMLGERNWYLPCWLGWIPRVGPEADAAPGRATRPEAVRLRAARGTTGCYC
jgi:RND superfamily putative drug exporter